MLGKKLKQNFRVIAILEELDDVSKMLQDYLEEYGYKVGLVSRLEINNPHEITILHIDPNNLPDLKNFEIECIVINLKNALVYKKEISKLLKKLTKTGSIIGDTKIIQQLEKKIPKNILSAKIDYTSPEENKSLSAYKNILFHAEGITKSFYKYGDTSNKADKTWQINNKYAYKMEALLFATVNSCGLIS